MAESKRRRQSQAATLAWASEAALSEAWGRCLPGPLRLADGRPLHVIFPGVPGPGNGPDFRGAVLDAGGDYLAGDVELHLLASGWLAHGHHRDPAYASVVLHVAGADDLGTALTHHASGRLIGTLIAAPDGGEEAGAGVLPPCVFHSRQGLSASDALDRLGVRRLRAKAARARQRVAAIGTREALHAALLEACGGPAWGRSFAMIAAAVPVEASPRPLADAYLRVLPLLPIPAQRVRPAARPEARLRTAASLVEALWPVPCGPDWPAELTPTSLVPALAAFGLTRALATEMALNAVIPVALAAGIWEEAEALAAWRALPSLAPYGHLMPLHRWLTDAAGTADPASAVVPERRTRPWSAAQLQGALLLHADYCTKGRCGRCPLSSG